MIKDGKGYIYMEVTTDKYEFPIHISDTIEGLSKLSGVPYSTIARQITDYKKGITRTAKKGVHWFRRVEYDVNDNYDDLTEVTDDKIKAHTIDNINRDYAEYIKQECDRIEKEKKYR